MTKAALFQKRAEHLPIHSNPSLPQEVAENDPALVNTPEHVLERIKLYTGIVLEKALSTDEWTFEPVGPELLDQWLRPTPEWQAEQANYSPATKQRILKALMTELQALQNASTGADKDVMSTGKTADRKVKETLKFQGFDIAVEYPVGSSRKGVAPDGTKWERPVTHPYGYIKQTDGADGDSIDCYVGPSEDAPLVYVVNQFQKDGTFDEHKVMLGFDDAQAALKGYLVHMPDDWTQFGPLTSMTLPEFRHWLYGDTSKAAAKTAGYYDPSGNKPGSLLSEDPSYKGTRVMVYRAVPAHVTTINPKDFVTLRRQFAEGHADSSAVYEEEPFRVIKALVPAEHVACAYNPGEYFYVGPNPMEGRAIYEFNPDAERGHRLASLPDQDITGATYYHGTSTLTKASSILRTGIRADKGFKRWGKGMEAVAGRVYMTQDLDEAMQYACFDYEKTTNGYLFVIPGQALHDVYPDEDALGRLAVRSWSVLNQDLGHLLDSFEIRLTELIREHNLLKAGEAPEFLGEVEVGKALIPLLNDEETLQALRRTQSLAHAGTVFPTACYRIDKDNPPSSIEELEQCEQLPISKAASSEDMGTPHIHEGGGEVRISLGDADVIAQIIPEQSRAIIEALFVPPALRGKGIGKILMGTLAAWLKDRGIIYLTGLDVSEHGESTKILQKLPGETQQFSRTDGGHGDEAFPEAPDALKKILKSLGLDKDGRFLVTHLAAAMETSQTESPAFKAWFAGSKVVDAQGLPLRVFHGTAAAFDTFQRKVSGIHGKGFYFTGLPNVASAYAEIAGDSGSNVMPVYLRITNPASPEDVDRVVPSGANDPEAKTKRLMDEGFDGVIANLGADRVDYVVFSPDQIKSAIGNNGDFSPNDHRITASKDKGIGSGEHAAKTDSSGRFWGNAGAGCVFFAQDTGRLLISYRSEFVNEPHTWGVWGGAMDDGENPRNAALREVREETGYAGNVQLRQAYVYTNGDFRYTTFLAVIPEEFIPELDWETENFKWCDLDDFPSPIHFGLKAALGPIKSLVKPMLKEKVSELKDDPGQTEHKSAATIENGVYSMPLEEAIDEHEKLVDALKTQDPAALQEEAQEQGGELEEMKSKFASILAKIAEDVEQPVIEDFYQTTADAMQGGVKTFDAFLSKLQTNLGEKWPGFLHAVGGYTGLRPVWDAVVEQDDDDLKQSLEDLRISPRLPSASPTLRGKPREIPLEDPHGEVKLQPDLATMLQDPKALKHNVDLMTQYPEFQGIKGGTATEKAERIIEHMTDNLIWLYKQWHANHRTRAKSWYVGGNRITHRWAKRFDCSPQAVAGVLAALSPQQHWFQNVTLAERVLSVVTEHANEPWDTAMTKTLKTRDWGRGKVSARYSDEEEGEEGGEEEQEREQDAKRSTPVDLLPILEGKTLQDLEDGTSSGDYLQALWIRAYDEAHNPNACRIVSPEGEFGDWYRAKNGKPVKNRWPSFSGLMKAISVFKDSSTENISNVVGANHKVRSFYNNLIAPMSSGGDVTIDTHAVAAALLRPLASSSVPVAHNFGSGKAAQKAVRARAAYTDAKGKYHKEVLGSPKVPAVQGPSNSNVTGVTGLYGFYAEAYRRAAEKVGIMPREMQSITWEAVRGLFKPHQKRKNYMDQADAYWKDYSDGYIDKDTTRGKLLEHFGGIEEPSWALPNPRNSQGERHSSYSGQLPVPDGPDGGPKGTARPRGRAGTPTRASVQGVGKAALFQKKAYDNKLWVSPDGQNDYWCGVAGYNHHAHHAVDLCKEFGIPHLQGEDTASAVDAERQLVKAGWMRMLPGDAGYAEVWRWTQPLLEALQAHLDGYDGAARMMLEQASDGRRVVLPVEEILSLNKALDISRMSNQVTARLFQKP